MLSIKVMKSYIIHQEMYSVDRVSTYFLLVMI